MSILDHARDIQVFDHQNLCSVHKGLGSLVNEVSPGIGDLAMPLGESRPRLLAALGPRCGSGQGPIGCFERLLRLLQCFHPSKRSKGMPFASAATASEMIPRSTPMGTA